MGVESNLASPQRLPIWSCGASVQTLPLSDRQRLDVDAHQPLQPEPPQHNPPQRCSLQMQSRLLVPMLTRIESVAETISNQVKAEGGDGDHDAWQCGDVRCNR